MNRTFIPRTRRIYSCHGAGRKTLDAAGLNRGLVPSLADFLVSRSAAWYFDGDSLVVASIGGKSTATPLCWAATASGAEAGADVCDPPAPRVVRLGPAHDYPRPSPILRCFPRLLAAVDAVDPGNLTVRLLAVRAGHFGLWSAGLEVRHAKGGRAIIAVEFTWHHERVYVGVTSPGKVPLPVTQAIDRAFSDGREADLAE